MSEHCQVDFYLLGSPELAPERLACKLAVMAWERGHKVSIVTESEAASVALDELLWRYPEGRFVPHERGEDTAAPVQVLSSPPGPADVVINLTTAALEAPLPFKRLLEIVPHRPVDREASREKFRHYRAAGLDPKAHDIN